MRRTALFTLAALASATVFGEGLLDCVEPDVLHTLLLPGQDEHPPVITAAMPAELATLRMSRDFTWIGSAERYVGRVDATTSATRVTAAWRSSLAPDAARTAALDSLTASGWQVLPALFHASRTFEASSTEISAACREGKAFTVTAAEMEGITYTLLTLVRNDMNPICKQSLPATPVASFASGLEQYQPHLQMPVDPATGSKIRVQNGGTGSSPGGISDRIAFSMKDSAGNIARQFAQQMSAQGWSNDANWSGTATAGSSWSKHVEAGVLQGTLSVTNVDRRQFIAELRITRLQ